jgi:hypothetical protein
MAGSDTGIYPVYPPEVCLMARRARFRLSIGL